MVPWLSVMWVVVSFCGVSAPTPGTDARWLLVREVLGPPGETRVQAPLDWLKLSTYTCRYCWRGFRAVV